MVTQEYISMIMLFLYMNKEGVVEKIKVEVTTKVNISHTSLRSHLLFLKFVVSEDIPKDQCFKVKGYPVGWK